MRKEKVYSSYEEVNRDLAIYALEIEIYKEKMKLDIEYIKEDLTLKNVISGYFNWKNNNDSSSSWISKLVLSFFPWTTRLFWKLFS